MAETTLRLQSKNLMKSMLYIFLKLINHPWGQKPTNEAYLGHMHEPWYPINTQLKILWVLIWDQTWFWSQINHLRSNQHFSIINTLLTTIPKMNWILFNIINFDSIGYTNYSINGPRWIYLPDFLATSITNLLSQ